MALKFLNKKGWHTGSLRNVENVWKAEQKHEAEQKKLEELRKQIHEERERSEFRLLQEQAGLVPKQERLDFLYDSGLAVGKGNSDGFKALGSVPRPDDTKAASSSTRSSVPGALFEEKPQSANDAWRKLHSDPLLLIRRHEQEALARVKNNPIRMAMIRKSVEATKAKDNSSNGETHLEKHLHQKTKHKNHAASSEHPDFDVHAAKPEERADSSYSKTCKYRRRPVSQDGPDKEESGKMVYGKKKNSDKVPNFNKKGSPSGPQICKDWKKSRSGRVGNKDMVERRRSHPYLEDVVGSESGANMAGGHNRNHESQRHTDWNNSSSYTKYTKINFKLAEEERSAKLQEMRMDAQLHEEQRRKRLKKAEEHASWEVTRAGLVHGSERNFLDAAHKSVYGAEKGGSSTIEESVRRRTHYLQCSSQVYEENAFRR